MNRLTCLLIVLAGLLLAVAGAPATAEIKAVDLTTFHSGSLGPFARYFQEDLDHRISLDTAIQHFQTKAVQTSAGNSISLGIGTRPAWLHVPVVNTAGNVQSYRFSIEIPWLDYIDVWLVNPALSTPLVFRGGDGIAFDQRPKPSRFFTFETAFPPGQTDVYVRVESLGPMAIPMRLDRQDFALQRDIRAGYEFGFLYGLMAGLALYNLILFLLIRKREFGLYSLYLIGFIANSLSYTGQLYTLITIDLGPWFQDWMDNFLMITYSVAGLHFARLLLRTGMHSPKLNRFTIWVTLVVPGGIIMGALFNALVYSLLLAFLLNTTFALLFIALGAAAMRAQIPSAKLFLLSSVQAAVCIGISTAAVGGLLPLNDFTFRLIEIGMSLEALLLAVILAQQFRLAQRDKLLAETFARTDPLTGLNNRRGFREIADKLWETLVRKQRHLSIVMMDIDHFKQVNDQYGHAAGDAVLKQVAQCIHSTIRKGDISARWGGEEFILLLPETDQNEALIQAERLRTALENIALKFQGKRIAITGSVGVCGTLADHWHPASIERMIDRADRALYSAKEEGRNQVFFTPSPAEDAAPAARRNQAG